MEIGKQITQGVRDSKNRIQGLLRRVVRHLVYPDLPGQESQIESQEGEFHDFVETAETYGHTAIPPDDVVEGIAAFIGGNADHGMVLAWLDKKYRPLDLLPGESAIYHAEGHYIKMRNGFLIEIVGDVVIEGSLTVNGVTIG